MLMMSIKAKRYPPGSCWRKYNHSKERVFQQNRPEADDQHNNYRRRCIFSYHHFLRY